MARPLTKGEPIGLRLPLPTDAWVRERAKNERTTPGKLVASMLVRAHGRFVAPEPDKTPPTQQGSNVCSHGSSRPVGTAGLRECVHCGLRFGVKR